MPSYLITGASRGIGLEFVQQLSAQPDNVVFGLVRNEITATKLLELAKGASNVHVLQADVVDAKALKDAAANVAKVAGGSLDVLINNAAYLEEERRLYAWDQYPEEHIAGDIQRSIQVNVVGVIYTTNAFLPLIRKSPIKKVITLSSALGDLDTVLDFEYFGSGPYSVSKAAVNMAVAKYAVRFKEEGVIFLTISPGLVDTLQGPPSPALLEDIQALAARLTKVYPDWDGQPIKPEKSVRLQLEVLNKATIQDTGKFVSQFGNRKWM